MLRKANILALLLIVLGSTVPAVAQSRTAQRQLRSYQYTDAIHTMLGERTNLDGLTDDDLLVLGLAHLRRAYLLQDMAALQAALGATYYYMRDTSTVFTPTPWNAYFLARHLFEHNENSRALDYFTAASKEARLSDEYRQRARIWAAASQARLDASSQAASVGDGISVEGKPALAGERAYARWKGGGSEVPACGSGPAASGAVERCRLWASIRSWDLVGLYQGQRALLHEMKPDYEASVGSGMTHNFYDPASLQMLAIADFTAAMITLGRYQGRENKDEIRLYAGISAFEAGHYNHVRVFLKDLDHPMRNVYLGALHYVEGDQDKAAQLWDEARTAGGNALMEWARIASRLGAEHRRVEASIQRARREAGSSMRAALRLGRALIQMGRYEDAAAVLERTYPSQYSPEQIDPDYLITFYHALLMAERVDRYTWMRSYFADLARTYPATLGVFELVQGFTLSDRWTSISITTGR